METMSDEAMDWWAVTQTVASQSELSTAPRLMFCVMALESIPSGSPQARTERQWALYAGMTPHQARQAIAALCHAGHVQKGWRTPPEGRPMPIYRPILDHPDDEQDGQ